MTGRYAGKPFVKFLDCYVLRAIGHLDPKAERMLEQMEPSLASTFGTEGTWFEIVAAQMEFPEHLPEKIASIWSNGKVKADQLGVTVDPVEFTHQFVDTNFVPK